MTSNPATDPLRDALHLLADEAMENGVEIGEAIEERRAQSPAIDPNVEPGCCGQCGPRGCGNIEPFDQEESSQHSTLEDMDVLETFLISAGASNNVKDALRRIEEQLEAAQKERDDAKQALAIFFEIMPEVTGRFFDDAHEAWADGREGKWDDQRFREELRKALAGHYPACEHEWVDATNEAVESGEMCIKCHAIRVAQSPASEPKP